MLTKPAMIHNVARRVAIAGLCAVAAACGAPSGGSATAPATSAPPTSATAPAAAAATTTLAPRAADASTAVLAVASTAAAAASDPVDLVLDSSTSSAAYHAHEQLVGKTLPTEAVGTSKSVAGSLVIDADGSMLSDQSSITVDLSKLQSDESRRDNFIKNDTLQTSLYPTATFVPRQATGLPVPLPTSGSATFELQGDLSVHGVTRPVIWQVTAQFDDTTVSGSATTDVKISDFAMTPPRVGPVLSIEDGLTLELAFTANRQA